MSHDHQLGNQEPFRPGLATGLADLDRESGTSRVRDWIGHGLLLAVLGVALYLVQERHRQDLLGGARDGSQQELTLLSGFVAVALRSQDLDRIDALFQSWGRSHADILELRLTAGGGQILAEYLGGTGPELSRLSNPISYQQREVADLVLVKGTAVLDRQLGRLRQGLLAVGLILGLAYWALAWTGLSKRRRTAELLRRVQGLAQLESQVQEGQKERTRLRGYLDGVLDSSPAMLVGVDGVGRITEWSRTASRLTHLQREDVLGLPAKDLIREVAGQEDRLLQAIANGREPPSSRHVGVVGGTLRHAEIFIHPLVGVDPPAAIIRVEDVTQQVGLEQMMTRTERLISLGGLAAGVAHEINSPLSGVLQNTQNVLRRLAPDLAANREVAAAIGLDLGLLRTYLERRKIPQLLDLTREAAARAGRIAADMLEYSRRGGTHFQKTAIGDLIETAVRLTASDIDMKLRFGLGDIEWQRQVEPDLPFLYCDAVRIEQVLVNLVRNAAQAMALADTPRPRRISLRAGRDGGQGVYIEVEDNGPGMSPEVRERIFEPFFTTKPPGAGTGLGLAVSHFVIVTQHGGRIEVETTPGHGCCCRLRLPLRPPQVAPSALALSV